MAALKIFKKFQTLQDVTWASIADGQILKRVGSNIVGVTLSGGDFSSDTSTSVDSEIVLFSGTAGKTGKRSTGTGVAKLTSGVLSTLSSTTVGENLLTATNPSAITFPKIAANNTVSFRTPAQVLSDIGAQASGSYAASGANADITSISTLTSFGTGSTATKFNSSGVLQIGGTTTSFGGLRNDTNFGGRVAIRFADNSDYARITSAGFECMNSAARVIRFDTNMGGGIGGMGMSSDYRIIWANTTSGSGDANVAVNGDTGFVRSAAGILAVTDGLTTNTYRDILTRGLRSNAVTFANAITSPVEGTLQAFTDSTTATWRATITGGGSNHVLGYYNGTNWTVAA